MLYTLLDTDPVRSCLVLRGLFKSCLPLPVFFFLSSLPAEPATGHPMQEMEKEETYLLILAFWADIPVDTLFLGHGLYSIGFTRRERMISTGKGHSALRVPPSVPALKTQPSRELISFHILQRCPHGHHNSHNLSNPTGPCGFISTPSCRVSSAG